MTKDRIFWIGWAVVVIAGAVFYFAAVSSKKAASAAVIEKKNKLAARFVPLKDKNNEDIKWKGGEGLPADKVINHLYPLQNNRTKIPNEQFVEARKEEDKALKAERTSFVKDMERGFTATCHFNFDDQKDFHAPPEANLRRFREWVKDEDLDVDKAFLEASGGRIVFKTFEESVNLVSETTRLRWLGDGRITGGIQDTDRDKVKYRLSLRRRLLLALARTQADVYLRSVDARTGDVKKELVKRGIDEVLALNLDVRAVKDPRAPFARNRVEIEVLCHPGVVAAMLRELESIGTAENRPFTFWAETVHMERPSGWPTVGDWTVKPGSKGKYGFHGEWPVKVTVMGIVPQFDPDKLDKEPK